MTNSTYSHVNMNNKKDNSFYIKVPSSKVEEGSAVTVKLTVKGSKTIVITKKINIIGSPLNPANIQNIRNITYNIIPIVFSFIHIISLFYLIWYNVYKWF